MPKTRQSLQSLIAMEIKGTNDVNTAIELLGHVYFQVHSQQINIRDKTNGKLIVSIRK